MTNKAFNVGIIGCGTIAEIHAKVLSELAMAKLVSAFSRNIDNAKRLSEKYDIKPFDNLEVFFDDPNLDVITICTPSGTHLDYGRLAARAGKHVIVEKPIEVSLQRAQALIDICKKQNVRLAVIYQNRFLPDVIRLKEKVQQGDLGKIFLADAFIKWYRSQDYYESADWRGTFQLDGGGVLINQAIHTIDLLQWIVGGLKNVFAQMGTYSHQRIEGEDTAAAILEFENGAIGVIEGSTSVVPAMDRRLEIHGTEGTAVLKGDNLFLANKDNDGSQIDKMRKEESSVGSSSPLKGFSSEPHRQQFENIFRALGENLNPPVSGEESMDSLAIVKAIYESARKGIPIHLQQFKNHH